MEQKNQGMWMHVSINYMGSRITSAWSQLLKSNLKIILQMTVNIYYGLKGYPFALLNLYKKKIFGKGKESTLVFLLRKYMLVSVQVWGKKEIIKVQKYSKFSLSKMFCSSALLHSPDCMGCYCSFFSSLFLMV